jgi:hypothetical protein
MSALVRFGRRTAILRAGRWVSADIELEIELNRYTSEWFQKGLAPPLAKGQERAQERAVAEEIARQFEGRVAVHVQTRRSASDKHFFHQRQLGFDFAD